MNQAVRPRPSRGLIAYNAPRTHRDKRSAILLSTVETILVGQALTASAEQCPCVQFAVIHHRFHLECGDSSPLSVTAPRLPLIGTSPMSHHLGLRPLISPLQNALPNYGLRRFSAAFVFAISSVDRTRRKLRNSAAVQKQRSPLQRLAIQGSATITGADKGIAPRDTASRTLAPKPRRVC